MNNPFSSKELEELLEAARAAGRAEGYAQAKLEMALERVNATAETTKAKQESPASQVTPPHVRKLQELSAEAQRAETDEVYKTRTTVSMTKTIALDYIKSVAPRIVGPSEIKKNSEKTLKVFMSFGTLARAMTVLVEAGEVEQLEPSRWRYKGRSDAIPLKSVK